MINTKGLDKQHLIQGSVQPQSTILQRIFHEMDFFTLPEFQSTLPGGSIPAKDEESDE